MDDFYEMLDLTSGGTDPQLLNGNLYEPHGIELAETGPIYGPTDNFEVELAPAEPVPRVELERIPHEPQPILEPTALDELETSITTSLIGTELLNTFDDPDPVEQATSLGWSTLANIQGRVEAQGHTCRTGELTPSDLYCALEGGERVTAAVDAAQLWPNPTSGIDEAAHDWAIGRAVMITGLQEDPDTSRWSVDITDPALPAGQQVSPVDLDRLLDATSRFNDQAIIATPAGAAGPAWPTALDQPNVPESLQLYANPATGITPGIDGLLNSIHLNPGLAPQLHLETLALPPLMWSDEEEQLLYTSLLVDRLAATQATTTPWGAATWNRQQQLVDVVDWGVATPAGLEPGTWKLPDSKATVAAFEAIDSTTSVKQLNATNAHVNAALPANATAWHRAAKPGTINVAPPKPLVATPTSKLQEFATNTERLARSAGLDEIARNLAEQRLERSTPAARIAVVGEFNRGKSTLVNRLIDQPALPTGAVPVTRSFVIIRPVTDQSERSLTIQWPNGTLEERGLDDNPWQDLTLDTQVPGRTVQEGEKTTPEPRLWLRVVCPWMTAGEIELIDTPGANEGRSDRVRQMQQAVAMSDVAVMTVAANSPFSMTEKALLEDEVLTHHVPHVVVAITMLDKIPTDERAPIVAAINQRVRKLCPGCTVVVASEGLDSSAEDLDQLRQVLVDLTAAEQRQQRRDLQLVRQIADGCGAITSAAEAGSQQQQRSPAGRQAALTRASREQQRQDREWDKLQVEFEGRADQLVGLLRDRVINDCRDLGSALDIDIQRSGELQLWWHQELPLRLRRELKARTNSYQEFLARRLDNDIGWLEQQIADRLGDTRLRREHVVVATPKPSIAADIQFRDLRRRRSYSRAVVAAGGIAAAGVAVATGLPMPLLFATGGNAIAAAVDERVVSSSQVKQIELVRAHLPPLIDSVADQYLTGLTTAVSGAYERTLSEVEGSRRTRAAAEIAAMAVDSPPEGAGSWTDLADRAAEIRRDLEQALHSEGPTPGPMTGRKDPPR